MSTGLRSWTSRPSIMARCGSHAPDTPRNGGGRLLQLPCEMLEATLSNSRAIGIALRDRMSGRLVAYALGSALEDHDEEGVASDPCFGDNNTFYLHATAARPSVQNHPAIENRLLDLIRIRVLAAGFEYISALIEERMHKTGPAVAAPGAGDPVGRQLSSQWHPVRVFAAVVRKTSTATSARGHRNMLSEEGPMTEVGMWIDHRHESARGRRDDDRRESGNGRGDCARSASAGRRRGRRRRTRPRWPARVAARSRTRQSEAPARGGRSYTCHASSAGRDDDARGRQADDREHGRDRVDDRVLRLLRGAWPPFARQFDPAQLRASGELHRKRAIRRGRGDRAVQLSAAAHGVEGGAGTGRGQYRRHQAGRRDAARDPHARAGVRRLAAGRCRES